MANATTPINEMLRFIRNSDILTTAQRGVTTTTNTGTFTNASSHLISVTNIKNIRSIVVATVTLTFGKDYDYDTNYLDTTIKTRITFTSPQTGAYTITYDYGTDKIFNDYPRDDLQLSSYPRITVDIISETNDAYGIGGDTFIENTLYTAIIYDKNQDTVREKIDLIKTKVKQAAKNFYNYPMVKPTSRGPIIKSEGRSQTILHGNIDLMGMFNVTTY